MGMQPSPFGTALKYEQKELKVVSTKPQVRPDAIDKVTGAARYAADYNLPGQLIGNALSNQFVHPVATTLVSTQQCLIHQSCQNR